MPKLKCEHVALYANENDEAKKLVEMVTDYAKHKSNELFQTKLSVVTMGSTNQPIGLAEKADQIDKIFKSELARKSGHSLSAMSNDIQAYCDLDSVSKFGANLQKIMVDIATPIFINATGLNQLAEFHYGGYGDVFSFEVTDNTLYNVSKMGERQKHTKVQERKKSTKTIATSMHGLTTAYNLPQYMVGDASPIEDAMLMALSINAHIYKLVVNKFVSATTAIADTRFKIDNYSEKDLIKKLRAGSAHNGGAQMVLVGNPSAVKDILPENAQTRIFLQDEYNTTLGHLSTFNTYKVIAFDDVYDAEAEDGLLGLPDDYVYGISLSNKKLIHVAIGATSTNTDGAYGNNDLSVKSTLRKQIGVELATNDKVVVCKLS